MSKEQVSFAIEEVTRPDDSRVSAMLDIFFELFPHLTPGFDSMLANRVDPTGRFRTQLFVGLCNNVPAGLLQVFYEVWRGGLVAIADLVGVRKKYRGTGLGLGLMHRALSTPLEAAARRGLPAQGLLGTTEPDQGEPQSWTVRRVRMFERMGAQVRRDLAFRFDGQSESNGEIILWFPMRSQVENVSTKELAWVLWQSGGLAREEFVKRYGELEEVERRTKQHEPTLPARDN